MEKSNDNFISSIYFSQNSFNFRLGGKDFLKTSISFFFPYEENKSIILNLWNLYFYFCPLAHDE